MAENYQDQLKYFKYGVKGFSNTKYINSIEYENNKIIMEEEVQNLINPLLVDLSIQVHEPVTVFKKIETKTFCEIIKNSRF